VCVFISPSFFYVFAFFSVRVMSCLFCLFSASYPPGTAVSLSGVCSGASLKLEAVGLFSIGWFTLIDLVDCSFLSLFLFLMLLL
jgi:hypothetical protein